MFWSSWKRYFNFTSNDFKLCLLGDFNAHTKNEYDFTTVDGNIQQSVDVGDLDISLDYILLNN